MGERVEIPSHRVDQEAAIRFRAIKIIATIGPACNQPNQIADLMKAGVDIFRFNFAHSTREEHAALIALVRQSAEKFGRPIGTLADISGPKIRLGKIPGDSALLKVGDRVTLYSPEANSSGWLVQLPQFCNYLHPGDPIYLADGTRKLIVEECGDGIVRAVVETGGVISSFKGINLPFLRKPLPAVSEKDLLDVECALKAGADWIGLSFVGGPEDLEPLQDLMQRLNLHRPVLAKLERRGALDRLDEIVEAFDGVMVARGDLGIEVEFEKVPMIQDRILVEARRQGKPAIVATQILTSMVNNPRPTRAEVTDIAYAVKAGADALMLSEETAIGQYPVEAVTAIVKVASEIETSPVQRTPIAPVRHDTEEALAYTAVLLAQDTEASAILCPTRSGNTARSVARFRPGVPVVVVSDDPAVVGELTLYHGLYPTVSPLGVTLEERIRTAMRITAENHLAAPGDKVVIVGGEPVGSGQTNLLMVRTMPD